MQALRDFLDRLPETRWPHLWLVLLCLALWLPGFRSLPAGDRDESRFAQASRQMVETGDYVRIRLGEVERNKKPAGIHWAQAASVHVLEGLGIHSEARARIWAYRIPSLAGALLAGSFVLVIETHIATMDGFGKCDREHFDALLHGGVEQAAALDAVLAQHVDRETKQLSPVEHAALMIGVYELKNCIEVPYRVVINEAVELAKAFGGTDGHKYVNGVLDRCASELRAAEIGPRTAKP